MTSRVHMVAYGRRDTDVFSWSTHGENAMFWRQNLLRWWRKLGSVVCTPHFKKLGADRNSLHLRLWQSHNWKSVLDRGPRADRPCYYAHNHSTPPPPLTLAASRHTPRRASSQLITSQWKPTTTAVNQHAFDVAVDIYHNHVQCSTALNFDFHPELWPWPMQCKNYTLV